MLPNVGSGASVGMAGSSFTGAVGITSGSSFNSMVIPQADTSMVVISSEKMINITLGFFILK
jgi:hypothetical protein